MPRYASPGCVAFGIGSKERTRLPEDACCWRTHFRALTEEVQYMAARTPEECDRLFAQYINAGNLDALVGLYEPRATFVPQQGAPVTGAAGIREALGGFVAMRSE